jgi:TM2 domain-containing membrane protein YozV
VSGGYQPMQSVNPGGSGAMIDWKAQGADKKIVAGVLAIMLGWAGVHKFILGYTTEGVIMLVITVVSCGSISSVIGLIEGIMYLTKTDEDFVRTYIQGRKGWF